MRTQSILVASAALLCFAVGVQAGEKSRFGVDVTEWSSATVANPPVIIPIGGSGQVNGHFVTGERNGIEIGLRASRRFLQNVAPLPVSREKSTEVGVYLADTGTSDGSGRATWNYDIHVDLRNAKGVAQGSALGDYDLTLDTDIGTTIFGLPVPLDLTVFADPATELFQTSQNPKFGNAPFDANAPGTYHFTLTLTPKTFNGPAISVAIRVVVSNP
jgi:hypothetical protein